MENELVNRGSGMRKLYFILVIFFSGFMLYFSVMSMLAPSRKMIEINNEIIARNPESPVVENKFLSDSLYRSMFKERAYLQSRIAMAGTDSIYLAINLSDSTANIEISGVVVHDTRVSKMQLSKLLLKASENSTGSMLSVPFTISSDYSTIRKEPVMIKMAPKDTSEYKPDIMPDTSLTEPVNYLLEMTDGTRIYIFQEEKEMSVDRLSAFRFGLKNRLRDSWISLKYVVRFRIPPYHPFIKIWIPRTDAKIIFRAIPKQGQVGIYI